MKRLGRYVLNGAAIVSQRSDCCITKEVVVSLEVKETSPIFRIFDVGKAKEFYLGFLGFTLDWEHRFDEKAPVYIQVSRGGLVLHLSEHYGDCCPGSTVFVRVEGLQEYHAEISAKGYGYMRPGIEETFHQSRGMQVVDPFGNRIRFDESLKVKETPSP